MAYQITPGELNQLDRREKNGYLRLITDIFFRSGSTEKGVVYIAQESNGAYLGPASELDIARQIAVSKGPSGSNSEYLYLLADALRALGEVDHHVFAIEDQLRTLNTNTSV